MNANARLGDLIETMARMLETSRKAVWEFQEPHCGAGGRAVRIKAFGVTPDFRNLVLLADASELAADLRSMGKLTIAAEDSDEILHLHGVTLMLARPAVAPEWAAPEAAMGVCPEMGSVQGPALLFAAVHCVEMKVPSHSISVLARSDLATPPPSDLLRRLLERLRSRDPSRVETEGDRPH